MEIPSSVYTTIAVVGTIALVLLSRLSPLRQWRQELGRNRLYAFSLLLIWGLLLWPQPQDDAFAAGSDLGTLRVVRVAVYVALFCACTAYFVLTRRLPGRSLLHVYAGYIAVCAASAVYSPSPAETTWKSFELLVLLQLASIWLLRARRSPETARQLLHGLFYVTFSVVLFSLVGILLYPDIAFGIQDASRDFSTASAWGIFPRVNANSLGQLGGTVLVFGLVLLLGDAADRVGAFFISAVGFAVLVAAHSRTSLIAAVLIWGGILLLQKRIGTLLALGLFAPLAVVSQLDLLTAFFTRGQDAEALSSMTGRMHMWTIAWHSFLEDPWLGKGFYAGHKTLDMSGLVEFYSSVDNTYLESLVNVGLIGTSFLVAFGLVVLAFAVLMATIPKRRPVDDEWSPSDRCGALIFVGFVMVRSATGPTFQALHINLTIMFACAVVLTLWRSRSDEERRLHRSRRLAAHHTGRLTAGTRS